MFILHVTMLINIHIKSMLINIHIKSIANNMLWGVAGDFNVVRYPSKRKGIGLEWHSRVEMERFN